MDFGLTKDDFVRCLQQTRHPMRLASDLDRIHLERLTTPANFVSVTEPEFNELKKHDLRVFACFERRANGDLVYSTCHSKMYREWTQNPSHAGPPEPEQIFGVNKDATRFFGHGYFECGDQRIEAYHFWIIDVER